ncbi:MAG: hypothetical protein AAFN10_10225 [Bacteroidota bacterium]
MADTIASIEAYLAGNMTEEEHLAFAERLSHEPELQAKLAQFKQSQAVLEQAVSMRLKRQMQQMQRSTVRQEKSISQKQGKQVKPLRLQWLRWGAVAALACLVLLAGIWWSNPSSSYQDYFEPYALASGLRGEANAQAAWQAAYQQKDYEQARALLAEIAHDETAWVEAQLYLGNIALAQQDPAAAIAPLNAVIEVQSVRFQSSAEWYLLLAYWGKGDKRSAKQLSQKIASNPQHPYHDKVMQLQKYLAQ